MRLENYIMEQDINTASVADIFVEQAQAELNVAMSLLDASVKDLTFQEFYIQEGELGDAVSAARAEVREDGKKHHIKAAFAAIKAFFKFLVTKIGAFFGKNKTDADIVERNLKNLNAICSKERGEKCDVKLPYTKEQFGKIYSFYENLGNDINEISDAAHFLVKYAIDSMGDSNVRQLGNGEYVKRMKAIKNFISRAKDADSVTEVKTIDYKKRIDELMAKQKSEGKLSRSEKNELKAARKAYVAQNKSEEPEKPNKPDTSMLSEIGEETYGKLEKTLVIEKAGEDETFIGYSDWVKFKGALDSAQNAWNDKKSLINKDIARLNKEINSNINPGGYETMSMDAAKNVKMALKDLSTATAAMLKPAADISKKCKDLTVSALTKSGKINPAMTRSAAAAKDESGAFMTRAYNSLGMTKDAADSAGVGIGDQSSATRTEEYKKKQNKGDAYEDQFKNEYYNYEDNYGSVYDALM